MTELTIASVAEVLSKVTVTVARPPTGTVEGAITTSGVRSSAAREMLARPGPRVSPPERGPVSTALGMPRAIPAVSTQAQLASRASAAPRPSRPPGLAIKAGTYTPQCDHVQPSQSIFVAMPRVAHDSELAPYVPRLVRAWSEDDDRRRARRIEGSLVSTDVSGFTALSERLAVRGRDGAEELVRTISGVFDDLIQVAERHGGDVLKFRGDALLLLFVGDRHAERACGAAADMQRAIESSAGRETSVGPVELRMACGVHTGALQAFLTEVPHRELLVAGRAATRVFELEDLAEAGEVALSAETAALVDAAWLEGSRDDAHLLRALEPGSSPVPPPQAVGGRELARYVPSSLRDHLAVASGDAEHRQVTVAFVKVSGTDAADEDPAAVAARIDALASATADACARYGLTWLESDIDADAVKLYLTGGAPWTTGMDEEAMLRALRDIVASDVGLTVRAGVNRGRVFTGDIGSATRRTYAVMGDAVNLAARLTGRARPGSILVTADVLKRTRTTYATEFEPLLLKGKEAAVMAHTLGEPTGTDAAERADEGTIVGRDAELDLLQVSLERARLRELQIVELVADPGVGKSRLVRELRARALGFQQLEAAAEPYAKGQPYAALRNLLRQLVGVTPEATRDDAGDQLTRFVSAVVPELVPWLPLLALPFDAEVDAVFEGHLLDPAASRERLHEAVATLLDRLLLMPTLLVVEDLHWLDDASHWLLAHLVTRPAPRPWLVVVTSRPGTTLLAGAESPATTIDLGPLDEVASTTLALEASATDLSEDAVEAIVARAGGNPLFVRALILAAASGDPLDALPESVESTLTALIDQLAPSDRMLLRHAAVVGPSFDMSVVEEVLGDELRGGTRWEALTQFILPEGESGYRFRHDLVRMTAYEGLSYRRRREIHSAVGTALERRAVGREDEEAALLSLHFHEAGVHEKAWRYATAAGDRSAAGYANVVAAGLYERALASADALDSVPPAELARVAEALGDVCERFADYDRSTAAYERGLAAAGENRLLVARLGGKRALLDEHVGRYEDALARYDDALAGLGEEPDGVATRAGLELGRAGVLYRQAHFEEAVEWAERAVAHAEQAGDRSRQAHALLLLGGALSDVGRDGIPELEQAIAIYEELGDFIGAARSLNNIGVQRYAEGRWDESSEAYRSSREAREQGGDVVGAAIPMNNEAEVLSDQGHLEEAEPLFRDMVRICRAAGYTLGALVGLGNLARVAARSGRFDEAETLYEETLVGFRELGSERFEIETRARVVECRVLAGAHARALELLDGLAAAAASFTYAGLEALIDRQHGYALHQARRPDEGRERLVESLRIARELGATYEEALTLRALAEVGADPDGEYRASSDAILERLGVVSLPRVPLP